jgi:predicted metal-binding membrane protein
MTAPAGPLAALLARDRALIGGGLGALVLAAWGYLVYLQRAMAMDPMAGHVMPWTAADLVFTVVMWAVMMVGMMLPAAARVILLFAAVNRKRREQGGAGVPTAIFVAGYLLVWSGFSLAAALAQWGLHTATLLSPMLSTTSPVVGGALLVAAGVYQLTPLKERCLAHCRSPLGFFMTEWRDGAAGALRMGLRHGTYCLGCCWILMGVLFVTGVMNLLWVAAIAAFVLLEKVAPAGHRIGRAASWALIAAGLVVLGQGTRQMGGM